MVIPNSVTTIESNAFSGCESLTSLTLGSSVSSLEYGSGLSSCPNLTELYSLNPTPPSFFVESPFYEVITEVQYMNLNVYVPQGSLSAYQKADVWKNFWELHEFDPTGVKTIKVDGKNVDGACYDIQGRKLNAPKKGLNIINGKKVLINK